MSRRNQVERWVTLLLTLSVLACGRGVLRAEGESTAPAEFQAWRQQREKSLRNESGYLALAGLYWLKDGYQTFGSAGDNGIVFPAGRAPERAGAFSVKAGQVTVSSTPGVELLLDGQSVSTTRMASDAEGAPTKIRLGDLTFWVIERSGRLGIRLRDPQCPILKGYRGTPCFEYAPQWRVQARFEPFETPRSVEVPNILGTKSMMETTGRLVFTIDGQSYALQPTSVSKTSYSIIFGDQTNGRQTYGGGRFLRVPVPAEGSTTVIDFNHAYNPPCAYNPHTTCPMPPAENKLVLPIEAGERIEGLERQ